MSTKKKQNQFVVVRCYYAGVHAGLLESVSADGRCVILKDAVRLWKWHSDFSLSEVAVRGVTEGGHGNRIGCVVPQLVLSEACEVLFGTEAAYETLLARAGK